MKRIFLSLLAILVAIGWMASPPSVHAQGTAGLTATVDRNSLTIGETLTLTLTLSAPDFYIPQLTLPSLQDFQVVGTGQSTQMSIINGNSTTTVTYTYQLQPLITGDLTIPAFSLDLNGQALSTDPIVVSVSQSSGAPGNPAAPAAQPATSAAGAGAGVNPKGNGNLLIESTVDQQSVFVGEPVQFNLNVYSNAMSSIGQPDFKLPEYNGFWHPQEPEMQQHFAEASDGTVYNVFALSTMLFPTTPGQATIDPATVTTSGGFFTSPEQVQSDPILIDVKPLPASAPAGFNGAVGQFEIQASPDLLSTPLGEPVTLRVELRGSGNWGTLGEPTWPSDENWRVYHNDPQEQVNMSNGAMTGSRVYEQLWTPLVEGQLALPAIQYSYFDPQTGQYQTITTEAQTIEVTPGDPGLAAPISQTTSSSQAASSSNIAAGMQIKPTPAVFSKTAMPLTQQTGFWLLFLVPVGLVAGDLSLAYRKHYLQTHAADLRRSQAYKRARRQLKRISHRSKNVHLEVAQIILTYLEDLIQQPLTGLSHSTLLQVFQANKISPELARRVIDTLFVGEASEYTSLQPASYEVVLRSARQLLEDLEKSRS
jgi:hypothetical protein